MSTAIIRCDVCGRFTNTDALILSEFIPPPCERMEDYISGGLPLSRTSGADDPIPAGAPDKTASTTTLETT